MQRQRRSGIKGGLLYALGYGYWTVLITGGGHGNFIWIYLFITAYMFGLFFPAIGFLAADLRPFWAWTAAALLVVVNLMITAGHVISIYFDPTGEAAVDMLKMWNQMPGFVTLYGVIHAGPLVWIMIRLIRTFDRDVTEPLP